MRKAATLGLLAAALIPLSLDQQSPSHAGDTISGIEFAETNEIRAKIQSILFTMARNSEIKRSMERSARARERERAARDAESLRQADMRRRAIRAAQARLGDRRDIAFTAKRNAEIRRSLAAYESARNARLAEARSREIDSGLHRGDANAISIATRNAEAHLSIARANDEPLLSTLVRLAPLIAKTSTIEPLAILVATTGTGTIETGSIEQATDACTTASP